CWLTLSSAWSTFTATRLPFRCVAAYTAAIPPMPRSASSRHLDRNVRPRRARARSVTESASAIQPMLTARRRKCDHRRSAGLFVVLVAAVQILQQPLAERCQIVDQLEQPLARDHRQREGAR